MKALTPHPMISLNLISSSRRDMPSARAAALTLRGWLMWRSVAACFVVVDADEYELLGDADFHFVAGVDDLVGDEVVGGHQRGLAASLVVESNMFIW